MCSIIGEIGNLQNCKISSITAQTVERWTFLPTEAETESVRLTQLANDSPLSQPCAVCVSADTLHLTDIKNG